MKQKDELPERTECLPAAVTSTRVNFLKKWISYMVEGRVAYTRHPCAQKLLPCKPWLSRTSCSLHPESLPLLKGISTLSDKQLPEGILSVPGVLRFLNIPEFCFKNVQNKGKSDINKPNFMVIPEKYCS